MKPCVLIPSYNEEKTIGSVVEQIKRMGFEVFVIDDGSADNTEKSASEKGALVMRHARNLGKGASIKEGFNFILNNTKFDTVILMDGDGQHDPKDIKKFIYHAEKYNDDIIIGNRMLVTKDMPLVRLATNKFMSYVLSLLCRQGIPDTQCGFRLIRSRVLKNITLDSTKYDLESEILIKAARKKMTIASVPIETIYNTDAQSSIHPVKDTLRFISLILKSYFGR